MQAIKQCYLAYINSEGHREANDLDEILGDARAMLPIKEYAALDAGVNDYCDALQEKAFVKLMRQPSFGYNTEYTVNADLKL